MGDLQRKHLVETIFIRFSFVIFNCVFTLKIYSSFEMCVIFRNQFVHYKDLSKGDYNTFGRAMGS